MESKVSNLVWEGDYYQISSYTKIDLFTLNSSWFPFIILSNSREYYLNWYGVMGRTKLDVLCFTINIKKEALNAPSIIL